VPTRPGAAQYWRRGRRIRRTPGHAGGRHPHADGAPETQVTASVRRCGYSGVMGMRGLPRRRFVQVGLALAGFGLLSGCEVATPRPPSPRAPRRIGHLWAGAPTPEFQVALRDQLRELGYVDGHDITIEDRVAGGRADALPDLAAELVRLPVGVIVTTGTPATLAARDATDIIPIVQASGTVDLAREGLVTSLARPGGNVTGIATIGDELTAKRLDFLKQTVPGLRRVAVLWNPASPSTVASWRETQAAAQTAGIELQSLEVRSPDELEALVTAASRGQAQALFPLLDEVTLTHRARIAALARAHRLPSILDRRDFTADGGLMSYGPSYVDMHRRAAVYVDKILRGTRPADLPVERPTTFDLAINVTTAQALGLTIPQTVLADATELIQ
jgi:putative ABC transport system substrate-binding protein